MSTPKIEVCKKICNECGFTGSTSDTLYADFYDILKRGVLFPCHKYLKSQTGSESYGVEKLTTVKVCRGYVAFVKKYGVINAIASNYPSLVPVWRELLEDIQDEELDSILSLEQLKDHHIGLREDIYLNNGNYIYK